MRAILLAGILLAGCAAFSAPPACAPITTATSDATVVHVIALNDGNLAGRLCVKLNDDGPLDAMLHKSGSVPNLAGLEDAGVHGSDLTVDAWMSGTERHFTRTFGFAGENYIVIVTARDGTLEISHHETQPVFD